MAKNRKLLLNTAIALGAGAASIAAFPLVADQASAQRDRLDWRQQAVSFVDHNGAYEANATLSDRVAGYFKEDSMANREARDVALIAPATDVSKEVIRMAEFSAAERQCLAEAVYYEARSEPYIGQAAVAEVVMNRVRHKAYPDSICGVVYEGSERTTGCQFSFTCDGSAEKKPRGRAWERSQKVADHALLGFSEPVTGWATHYHTTAVDPHWSGSMYRIKQIGTHIFYKFQPRRSVVASAAP